MIYKRHCILDLTQCARASTCPDTLLDACERPRANLDSTIALACSSLPATMHTFIVPSSSARSCRYAICAQRCACERERPLLASSLSCAHAAEQARHRKQALGQRRPPLRPPHSRSEARDDAAPAQRPRGRTLDCTARTPRQLHIRPAATTDHPPQQPARRTACTPCRLFALRAQVMSPRVRAPPCRSGRLRPPPPQRPRWTLAPPPPNSRKMACKVLFTLLEVFGRAIRFEFERMLYCICMYCN